MSRFPFGLLLSTLVLSSSCASMMAPSAQTPGLAQQQHTNPKQSAPKQTAPPTQRPVVPVVEQVLPDGVTTLDIEHSGARPTRIELGKPQPFPGTKSQTLATQKPVPVTKPATKTAPSATGDSIEEVWKLSMKSGTGRLIQMSHVGNGPNRILILGSIYGNEPESIELLDSVAEFSGTYENSKVYSFVFLRTPNPDGLAEHIHTNHNGVDLNRNFPSTWFTATPNRLTGPHPASEIETENLIKILKGFQPHRVIHVRSSIGQRPLVLFNKKLEHSVDPIREQKGWSAGTFDGEYKIGSVEEFVTLRANAELIAVHLPPKGFQQMSAKELLDLATLQLDSPDTTPEINRHKNNIANTTPQEVLPFDVSPERDPSQPKPDGEFGYVEILPPPPNRKQAQNSGAVQVTDDPKYYELPPPPGR